MKYSVSAIDPQFLGEEILALWSRNLPQATFERFSWLYGRTAASQAWVLHDQHHEPIGSAGLMPRQMSLCGQQSSCGGAIDLNVDRAHRTVGPALALQRTLVEDAARLLIPLIYALPSPNAVPVMRRLGYVAIGEMRRWAKPLRTERKLRKMLKTRLLSAPASFIADRWLALTSSERGFALPEGWTFEQSAGFNSGFDELWNRSRGLFAVLGERSSAYLNWRYRDYPDCVPRPYALRDERGRLRGYAVINLNEGLANVSDLWFEDDRSLPLVIGSLLQTGREQEWATVSFPVLAGRRVTDVLTQFGLTPRDDVRHVFAWLSRTFDAAARRAIVDGSNWYLTKADSDTDV
jgi:hypothetical protein